jgi:hypothetical protein
MSRLTHITPEFVEFIPTELKEGVLYVSEEYGTASHKCACGCGTRVVTPLTPTDWRLTVKGKAVSLSPSIGNWDYPCRSHYWIKGNRIVWAPQWSREEVAAGRQFDRRNKEAYFDEASSPVAAVSWFTRLWARLRQLLSRRK